MKKLLLLSLAILGFTSFTNAQTYCTTGLYTTGCSDGDNIDDFTLGAFTHLGTGCSGGGYNNYTSMNITITQNIPQNLTVSSTYANGGESLKLWIDFNADGDFNDAGENIYTSS